MASKQVKYKAKEAAGEWEIAVLEVDNEEQQQQKKSLLLSARE